jgi:hypothetical protein
MDRKQKIHELLAKMSDEVFEYVREKKISYKDGWVPSVDIIKALELNFVCVPKKNKQYGEKGWLFAILARILEDEDRIEHRKDGNRSFFRAINT